jgi:hypothetical protein
MRKLQPVRHRTRCLIVLLQSAPRAASLDVACVQPVSKGNTCMRCASTQPRQAVPAYLRHLLLCVVQLGPEHLQLKSKVAAATLQASKDLLAHGHVRGQLLGQLL